MEQAADNRAYWVWLQHAFGPGSPKPWRIFRTTPGGVRGFYELGPSYWNTSRSITDREAGLLDSFPLSQAEAKLGYAQKGVSMVLTPECAEYPEALRNIYAPPAVLYVKGSLPEVDCHPAIAVVGSRRAEEKALEAARAIAYQLALEGAVLATGCAQGVDSAALSGALRGMGKAVVFLPEGLQVSPINQERYLRQQILDCGGALVSEFDLDSFQRHGAYQMRNRLISGLCCGVLVVQAAAKSGTMITAKYAREQDRDIFVYPGDPENPAYAGSAALIEDGAKPVTSGREILEEYELRFQNRQERAVVNLFDDAENLFPSGTGLADSGKAGETQVSEEARRVYGLLGQSPRHLADLAEEAGLPASRLLALLTELEVEGLARSHPGKRYSR